MSLLASQTVILLGESQPLPSEMSLNNKTGFKTDSHRFILDVGSASGPNLLWAQV